MLILKKTQAPSYCLGMLWFVSDSWLIRGIESIFHWEIRWKRSSYFSWKQSSRTRQLSSSYAVTMGTNSLWRYILISITLGMGYFSDIKKLRHYKDGLISESFSLWLQSPNHFLFNRGVIWHLLLEIGVKLKNLLKLSYLWVNDKSTERFFQIFVVFLENFNFNMKLWNQNNDSKLSI